MTLIETIQRMQAIGAPILAIQTPDQLTTVQTLRSGLNGTSALVSWDCVAGVVALNERGRAALVALAQTNDVDPAILKNPVAALTTLAGIESKAIVLMINAGRFIHEHAVLQAVMNLRDQYKANNRVLVLLGPDLSMPIELQADVLTVDEPLPTPEEVGAIVAKVYSENEIKHDKGLIAKATDALRGLAGFSVEQAASMAYDPKADKIDVAEMWTRKHKAIDAVKGLGFERPTVAFDQIGGLLAWKEFMSSIGAGPYRPRAILLLDEFEKAMAGAGGEHSQGDTSGTSQDQVQIFLREMEDRGYIGLLNYGAAGTGKTHSARAAAAEFGCPLIPVDLGAAKGPHVGESEIYIRQLWKTIHGIVGDQGAFVIGAVNSLVNLSGPVRRRFPMGVWFFDLPDSDERIAIGKLQAKAFKVADAPEFWSKCKDWSGANIRDCCRLAYALNKPIVEAARFIVATGKQDPESLKQLRVSAAGKYLSASYPGEYQMPESITASPTVRKFERDS